MPQARYCILQRYPTRSASPGTLSSFLSTVPRQLLPTSPSASSCCSAHLAPLLPLSPALLRPHRIEAHMAGSPGGSRPVRGSRPAWQPHGGIPRWVEARTSRIGTPSPATSTFVFPWVRPLSHSRMSPRSRACPSPAAPCAPR
jgi:hypothetical protein